MPWLVIHGRDRGLLVSGSESGHPIFTRQVERALRFDSQDRARKWIERETVSVFGELALMRAPGSRAEHNRAGKAGHYGPRAST